MAIMHGRHNVKRMSQVIPCGPHRTRINKLLTQSRWDPEAVLQEIARRKIATVGLTRGDRVHVILDDTSKRKRGKRIPGVDKYFDHVLKTYQKGHIYVACLLETKGVIIPWGIKLHLKKTWCKHEGRSFKKLTELAAELIRSLPAFPEGVEVVVLFDSYYLCRAVIEAMPQGWFFVSRLKSNRNIVVEGAQRKAGQYAKNLLRRRRQTIHLKNGSGKRVRYRVAGKPVYASKVGKVYLVASRRAKESHVVALATNALFLKAREVVAEACHRWAIEVFFKEEKQELGLGEYQTKCLDGVVKHLHLSLIAYALLTHVVPKRPREKAKTNKHMLSPSSVQKMQAHLRRTVGKDLIDYIADRRKKLKTQLKQVEELLLAA